VYNTHNYAKSRVRKFSAICQKLDLLVYWLVVRVLKASVTECCHENLGKCLIATPVSKKCDSRSLFESVGFQKPEEMHNPRRAFLNCATQFLVPHLFSPTYFDAPIGIQMSLYGSQGHEERENLELYTPTEEVKPEL
jgi:hypothetical protein